MLNMGVKVKCYHAAFTCTCILGKSLNFKETQTTVEFRFRREDEEESSLLRLSHNNERLFVYEVGYEPQPSFRLSSLKACLLYLSDACHIWSALSKALASSRSSESARHQMRCLCYVSSAVLSLINRTRVPLEGPINLV